MPKLIDYPRTSYTGAWELAEIVDDTGGKCAIDTAARKLNRKVSGSFKAIIGSAVKFGLMTSKRELLSTTTLFKRIKHAYDKAEEMQFHREAFLTPPLFTQLCRKFRNRELPIQMLDVMLMREFGVEEINAQGVAKAFVDGCRMCALIDDNNIIADIDALNSARSPRRELASTIPPFQAHTPKTQTDDDSNTNGISATNASSTSDSTKQATNHLGLFRPVPEPAKPNAVIPNRNPDAVESLFGLEIEVEAFTNEKPKSQPPIENFSQAPIATPVTTAPDTLSIKNDGITKPTISSVSSYQMQMSGPGVNTALDITDEADIAIAIALLEKIRRQLRAI